MVLRQVALRLRALAGCDRTERAAGQARDGQAAHSEGCEYGARHGHDLRVVMAIF
jgi:hypothetical protein